MSVDRAITPHFTDETDIFVPADEAPYRPVAAVRAPAPARPVAARQAAWQEPVRERVLTGPALVAAASRLGPSVPAQLVPARTAQLTRHVEDDITDEEITDEEITGAPRVPTWTPVLRQVPAGEYDAHATAGSADTSAGQGEPVRAPLAVVAPAAPAPAETGAPADDVDDTRAAPATDGWSTPAWSTQGWSQGDWAGHSWPAPPSPTPASNPAPLVTPAPQDRLASAPPPWLADAPAAPQATAPVRRSAPAAPPVRRAAPLVASEPVVGSLAADAILRRTSSSASGWRRTVSGLTGGRWNPGPSAVEAAQAERLRCIRTPVRSCRRVAVMSVKGGVGKTTVASMLGLTFADLRSDRVLAVDANPDLGTLADRLTGDVEIGIQHLLDFLSAAPTFSVTDIEGFVSTNGRLQVLAGSREPCSGAAFTPEEYEEAIAALSSCYSVMVVDTGTGLSHSALAGVLATADDVVIVAEPTVDAASRASMTLDWLASCGLTALAEDAIVVMSHDRGSREIDERAIREHFSTRCGAVVEVPADPHLAAGGRIDRARCKPATRAAFEELAAVVGEGFAHQSPGVR